MSISDTITRRKMRHGTCNCDTGVQNFITNSAFSAGSDGRLIGSKNVYSVCVDDDGKQDMVWKGLDEGEIRHKRAMKIT